MFVRIVTVLEREVAAIVAPPPDASAR